jgi:hypothetical protein
MTTNALPPYNFGCDLNFINLMLRGLGKLPAEESLEAINAIRRTVHEQDEARAKAAEQPNASAEEPTAQT